MSVSARAAEPSVPAVLEPWRAWVLDGHPQIKCPPRFDDGAIRPCVWLSTLDLDVTHTGGRFTIDVETFADADVVLPGGADQWPVDVRADGAAAIVTRSEDRPRVRLAPGATASAARCAGCSCPMQSRCRINPGCCT